MQAEIITIGDEILIGQILDSNSKWIAEELNKIGVSVYQITSIQDDKDHIVKAISEAEQNADIILITGGLGPTKDDITKHTIAGYFDDELVHYQEIEEHIKMLFAKIKYEFTDKDIAQAMLPKRATILKNYFGTASGMWFNENGKIVVSMPGVPNEMKKLMENSVLPKLVETFDLPYIIHKTIITYGMGESKIADRLSDFENGLPEEIKLAYLPSYGRTRLRLSARGKDKAYLLKQMEATYGQLSGLVADIAYADENTLPLEEIIGKLLIKGSYTVATAESCTGGNIAKTITSVPGASAYFKGSVVSYSRDVKSEILKVARKTIEKHSVVSAEVAKEMAVNCKQILQTDFAIATTGNAGPTKDKTDATLGDVYIAIATPKEVVVKLYNFGQPREKVIQKATYKALGLLQKVL